MLNAAAIKELDSIIKHVKKGCLSGIEPGCGTNRNECLHKDLNKIMSSSRYGVELAYALFTVCFYKHNQKMTSSTGHIYPIEFYHSSVQISCVEKFGLSFTSSDSSISESEHHSAPQLDITSCTYAELYARISGTPACHMIQGSDAAEAEEHVTIWGGAK